MRTFHKQRRSHRRQAGVGLIDALIAMAVLAFGLLALVGMQSRLIAQSTEAQARLLGTQVAEELMSLVVVDAPNAACYTDAQTGCASAAATTQFTEWKAAAAERLTGNSSITSVSNGSQLTLSLNWRGKSSQDLHTYTAVTDVR